jgi:hypothetical protein
MQIEKVNVESYLFHFRHLDLIHLQSFIDRLHVLMIDVNKGRGGNVKQGLIQGRSPGGLDPHSIMCFLNVFL